MQHRIYLDNAATSWPKPASVYQAIDAYLRENGAPAGRGGYGEAIEVERTIADCRRRVAVLINAQHASEIVFTANCTDSLNMVLHGWLNPGDHVVTTVCEHNSVLRPLHRLETDGVITVERVNCDQFGNIDPELIRRSIRNETRLIAMTHASNVTGVVMPVEAVGRIAAEHDVPFLLDAAQSIGVLPIDVRADHISFLAAPGHKNLFGPLGSGLLYLDSQFSDSLRTVRQGGTGTSSNEDRQPDSLPEKYESGNLNVPAIVGLNAGLKFLSDLSIDEVHQKTLGLTMQAIEGLRAIDAVKLLGADQTNDDQPRAAVASFEIEGYDSAVVVNLLDASFGIQLRGGFHCAPLIHSALQADPTGSVRISPGWFNDGGQIEQLLSAVREIVEAT